MSWTHIEAGKMGEAPLDLYEKSGEYMIRLDGIELMNSFCHDSELMLATVAREACKKERAKILIAGLGLGYTLGGILRQFAGSEIDVVEKSSDVLTWYEKHFRRKVLAKLDDSLVSFRNTDIREDLRQSLKRYDLIVVDVDNGPKGLISGNNELYSDQGLARIYDRLTPEGHMLLWSAFASEEFALKARTAGFSVECRSIDVKAMRESHYIYLCQKQDCQQ